MKNRDLLKEAIADAKAVKETAIANAKAALEESFTPLLKEKFAAKLAQMEEDEELEEAYNVDEAELEEYGDEHPISTKDALSARKTLKKEAELEEYGDEHPVSTKDALKKEAEEEVDLEELLRELDEMDENINLTDFPDEPGEHGNVAGQNVTEAEEAEEEEIDIENMDEDDLKSFIEDVIADMVAAGELEAGEGAEEGEEEEGEEEEGEEMEASEEEVVAEAKKKAEDAKKMSEMKKKMDEMKKELDEAYSALNTIKTELNEVNLFNAKLLYTNKIFKTKNLTESQKVKILAAFDKATSIKEAKLVFETLSEGFKETKKPVNESLLRGSASKSLGVVEKKPILEVNNQFARWQQLAGINTNKNK
jgi:hypothetical protein